MAHLTDGWEPEGELDAGDTVVRRFLLHLAEYYGSTARANRGRVHRHDEFVIADSGRPASFFNSTVVLRPVPDGGWADVLDEVEAFHDGHGTGDHYLWSVWPTPDLTDRGWELEGHPPLMVRQPGGDLPPPAEDLDIRRVGDAEALADWENVAVTGFPLDDLLPFRPGIVFDERILDDDRWRFWVGYHHGSPVAIGTQFVSHGFSQLALGVTLSEARGHGFWYALVRERLLAEPGLVSGSVFSDDSRPGAERLGYLPIIRLTLWRRARTS